ncbi:putative chromatin regulator PHD family [Helianthus annuus]|nr:putative chromatin regulator PHD family [Helianthus annuus]
MSSHAPRIDRRDNNNNNNNRPRFPRRQEWIPRGSSTVTVDANPPSSTVASNSEGNASHNGVVGNVDIPRSGPHLHLPNGQRRHGPRGAVNQNRDRRREAPRGSNPTAAAGASLPQLVQEIQDKLLKGTIECMICYDMVKRSAPIWSCSSCYSIFHLHCIKKWARAPTSIDLSAEKNQGFNWRCPGCQSVQLMSSKDIRYACFCKKKTEIVVCGEMTVKGQVNVEEDGIFSCNSSCGKPLACGNHVCKETCHPGVCGDCDLLPGRITSCYCGKSPLQEERHSCLDPIPTCSQICSKTLPCWLHGCKETCHPGSCPPCKVMVNQKCRCGSTSRSVECFNTTTFTCDKPCGRKKSCGRHRCSDKCCPLSNSNNAATQDMDPHLCSKPCEKKLRCGQHDCGLLCHSGHCPPCPERIFTDLTCACGRSSIPPPLPCGTPPPSCQYPCSVPQPCGHVSSHSCHFGDCPPCSVPIPKECIGGHVVLRNIPCGSKDIRCNKLCGKTRQCGMHACLRTCHPTPCDSTTGGGSTSVKASCGQTCGAPRRDCRHTCTSLCHPYGACPDVRCEFPVTIACGCGRITATVPCDAGGNNSADSVLETSAIQKLPAPLQPVESNGKKIPLGQRKLMCDDECAKVERKKVLADAFGVTNSNLEALHFGENPAVSDVLGDLYRRDSKWVLAVEERCKMLVVGKGRGGVKVHVFCPMLKEKRDAVRLIAERWKLSISAAGWEPKRFIVIHVTPKSKAPSRVIGAKGLHPHPPSFDPLVDMDPRLVVALFDLPSDADVSALVLRFGGECELVWLNDKNALAVFSDPARAATAMRRLDHGSVYYGAAVVNSGTTSSSASSTSLSGNAWASSAANPWKKAVVQESSWSGVADPETTTAAPSPWMVNEGPIITTAAANRWSILESDHESGPSATSSVVPKQDDVVEDWEKAYE